MRRLRWGAVAAILLLASPYAMARRPLQLEPRRTIERPAALAPASKERAAGSASKRSSSPWQVHPNGRANARKSELKPASPSSALQSIPDLTWELELGGGGAPPLTPAGFAHEVSLAVRRGSSSAEGARLNLSSAFTVPAGQLAEQALARAVAIQARAAAASSGSDLDLQLDPETRARIRDLPSAPGRSNAPGVWQWVATGTGVAVVVTSVSLLLWSRSRPLSALSNGRLSITGVRVGVSPTAAEISIRGRF